MIVAAQFLSASALLIAILVMQTQSAYIRKATLDDPFLVLANHSDTPAGYATLRAELLRSSHIKGVTASSAAPWEIHNMGGPAGISVSADPLATRRPASRNFNNTDFFATSTSSFLQVLRCRASVPRTTRSCRSSLRTRLAS